jgi:anaerobic dimethyl sulfoxide reductase subunit A
MNDHLTRLVSKPFTRRRFLEGMGAVGATAALASCGSAGKDAPGLFQDNPANVPVPPINGVVVAGAAPHNCGGRCVTKAYVENGVVKRFVTDERPDQNIIDGTGDDPQRRACPRCHAHKGYMYRADRLLKPLKQMGQRGDVNGFVEISWDPAFTLIAHKLQALKTTYGPASFLNHYASGDGAVLPNSADLSGRLLNFLGGSLSYRQDYSLQNLEHAAWFVLGWYNYFPQGNGRQDVFNAEQVVCWSWNGGESIWGTNSMWYLQQAHDMGKPVTIVDSRVSQTMATVATDRVMPVPGTDSALILAMLYHLLAEPTLSGGAAGSLLDVAFIRKYVHGFFDDDPAHPELDKSYHADVTSYPVPPGASLSAFILGGSVTHASNQAASIYPEKIGYNLNPDDPISGQTVSIWGQAPKTPEWAEKITGVAADKIRSFAESFVNKKTTIWWGGGWNRGAECEQAIWLCAILAAVTKNWGMPGQAFGIYADFNAGGFAMDGTPPNTVNVSADIYDTTRLSVPPGNMQTFGGYTPPYTQNTFPVFLWSDVAKNAGTGKSDWNDGQVKALKTPLKAIMNFGGNMLGNQDGNARMNRDILANKNGVELIVVADLYMTASAALGDYVLPVAAAYEKVAATTTWLAGDNVLYMGKAVEPPGLAMDDYAICTGIADKLGFKDQFTGGGKTAEDWVKAAWDKLNITKMTYEQWKTVGVYSSSDPKATPSVHYDKFRADPANPYYTLATPSGRFEAYSQAIVEDYCARHYDNISKSTDPSVQLKAPLFDPNGYAATDKSAKSTAGRFVYPIPMYIPLAQGRHANESPSTGDVSLAGTGGIPHDDPLGLRAAGYNFMLHTFHMQYRSHSTHNNNAFLNEIYKKDAQGEPAFLSPKTRTSRATWEDGVYEPIWINPVDALQLGINHGDRVLVTSAQDLNNPRSIYASANVTQRARPGVLNIGQGAWPQLNAAGIDVGGCANTLTGKRPARIGQGMTLGQGTLVKIEKA